MKSNILNRFINNFIPVLILVCLILPSVLHPAPVHAAGWYDASWGYRKSITVADASVDYQTKLIIGYNSSATGEEVDCNSHCRTDFADLRFTGNDGTTLIDHWIEKVQADGASYNATVWVQNNGDPDSTLYMYYGNAAAASASNGTNTFILFDDFERGANTDEVGGSWTETSGTCEISTGQAYSGTRSAKLVTNTTAEMTIPHTATTEYAIRFRAYIDANTTIATGIIMSIHGDGSTRGDVRVRENTDIEYYGTAYQDTGSDITLNQWEFFELRDWDWAGNTRDIVFNNAVIANNVAHQASASDADIIRFRNPDTVANLWIDNFIVRKWAATEQTFSAFGAEESAPTATPSTTTNAVINVEETTATYNGTTTAGANIVMRGFAWGTTSNSTTPGNELPPASYTTNWTEQGSFGLENFTYGATSLTSAGAYYVRAYSYNTTGYGWGNEESFFTKPQAPTALVCTTGNQEVTLTITAATPSIGATMYTYIRYKAGSYPSDISDGTFSYNGTGASHTQGGLINGTAYYFAAWSWATEDAMDAWSDATANCTATPVGGPQVVTLYCSGYSQTTAILNGEVTSFNGVAGITEHGFDYGLTTGYGSSQTTAEAFSLGEFNESISGLEPATLYHFRAKALGDSGVWGYGGDMVFATKGSPTLEEYWNTGGDGYGANITGSTWAYQTFTTNSTDVSRSITSIKLSLLRVGNPGTVTVSIRHTSNCTIPSCWCWPTGEDIITAALSGDSFETSYSWQEFVFETETCFEPNTTYAIVVRAIGGDSSNYIRWYWDAGGGYGGGNAGDSTDSGVTWDEDCPADYLFEVWGNTCLELEEAKVFTSYINSGDWLITVLYKNFSSPYYEEGDDVSSLFYLQLVDGTTVKAQSKVPEWGYRPGCIYLSSDMVGSLEWGESYIVRIWGNYGDNPHMDYTLQPIDWMGSDLTRLDSWVRSVATKMETYYGVMLTQYISGKGICLNEDGGVIFATNIPELDSVRPNLFTIVSVTPGYEQGEHTQEYARSLAWQTLMGEQMARVFTSIGNAFGMSGSSVGTILVFAFYAAVAFMCFPPGHAIAAVVIPIPILLFVWGSGLAQLALMAVILAVAIILLIWQFWWKGA